MRGGRWIRWRMGRARFYLCSVYIVLVVKFQTLTLIYLESSCDPRRVLGDQKLSFLSSLSELSQTHVKALITRLRIVSNLAAEVSAGGETTR